MGLPVVGLGTGTVNERVRESRTFRATWAKATEEALSRRIAMTEMATSRVAATARGRNSRIPNEFREEASWRGWAWRREASVVLSSELGGPSGMGWLRRATTARSRVGSASQSALRVRSWLWSAR